MPLKNPQYLKCLATVPCDLSLITVSVSNYCLFSNINILQGSVATPVRCGGIFSYRFAANLSPSLTVKEFGQASAVADKPMHATRCITANVQVDA